MVRVTVHHYSHGLTTFDFCYTRAARDLGFASFGELVIFVPSPARLKTMQKDSSTPTNYVDGMVR